MNMFWETVSSIPIACICVRFNELLQSYVKNDDDREVDSHKCDENN